MATIRSEGGLLPADILARVAALDPDLGGLTSPDFHLVVNERLGEAIARSWARLTSAWEAFSNDRDGLQAGDHAGKLTRERWLLPLFSELGYGRLVQQPGVEIDGKSYAVFCEYNHSPIHLVGAGVPLDRRTAGVRGAADQSPHSVVQELLNRSPERLWGIVTNGLSLRLLRDNVTLTRQAYVEFDLEAIFASEAYEDFALLWLCTHQSRFEAEIPEDCWLERWTQAAQRDGTRALGELRSGVERAIEALGRGFLTQPANGTLHDALRDGDLDGVAYYRELMRLIYRLLFLFVAEDRDVLLLPDDGTAERHDARARYAAYYGTGRIRRLSVRRRGGRAHDLYEQIKLLCGWLHDGGQPILALPALGSALWDPDTTPHVTDARLGNEALLEAIRELSYVEGGRRPVDFRNLGAEELGSVYESLLELHPVIDREVASFALTTAAGHDRKQTGSYYTPTSLIASVLDTALDPIIGRAAQAEEPEKALLDITVCDPASGSGHFLIAAANRIAKRLAAIREQDPEPAPEAIRHALRDVVSRCVHGVDMNPMAVELCKVSLWLEALEPGRPLSFLDDRILLGNSLHGAIATLVDAGVPDEAFKLLPGDDKDVVKAWRQHNVRERHGQTTLRLDGSDPAQDAVTLATLAMQQRELPENSIDDVRARAEAHAALLASEELARLRLAADTWTAAFTTPKRTGSTRITTAVVRRASELGPDGLTAEESEAVRAEVARYNPLHWHLAFPAVFSSGAAGAAGPSQGGGFGCVLGNPPWDQLQFREQEFFAARAPEVADATGAKRKKIIEDLEDADPELFATYVAEKRAADGQRHYAQGGGRFPLTARARMNTYALFAECARGIASESGAIGMIVPTGIATDESASHFFADVTSRCELTSFYDFENKLKLFPTVDSRARFALVTLARNPRGGRHAAGKYGFFLQDVADLNDAFRLIDLTADDIAAVNPTTLTCPVFRSQTDATICVGVHRRLPFLDAGQQSRRSHWTPTTKPGLFNMAGDSGLFVSSENADGHADAGLVPLYEGKMFALYDHRFARVVESATAAIRKGQSELVSDAEHESPQPIDGARYFVPTSTVESKLKGDWDREWILGWKEVTAGTNERTLIPCLLPRVGIGHKVPIMLFPRETRDLAPCLAAALSSFACDYIVRQKISGTSLTPFVIKQLPVPDVTTFREPCPWHREISLRSWVEPRVLELSATATDMAGLASDLGHHGPPFRWDRHRRKLIRAELDAAFFWIYGYDAAQVSHALDSFAVLRRKEDRVVGHFESRALVLAAFEAISAAEAAHSDFISSVMPSPGSPKCVHGAA